jgi:hypothetical protein
MSQSARRNGRRLWWLWSLGDNGSHLPLLQSIIVLVKPLAEVFLLGLKGGLRGIAIQVCAALVFYVGDNFGYFHRLYLAEVPKLPF